MEYANYEFYKNIYQGSSIPENMWNHIEKLARGVVDNYTFGRLIDAEVIPDSAALALCAIADALYAQSTGKKSSTPLITAESTDGYSVNYESARDTANRHKREIINAIDLYLPRSDYLRYAGVR